MKFDHHHVAITLRSISMSHPTYASRNRKDISATNFGGLTKTPGEAKIEKYKYSPQMFL